MTILSETNDINQVKIFSDENINQGIYMKKSFPAIFFKILV